MFTSRHRRLLGTLEIRSTTGLRIVPRGARACSETISSSASNTKLATTELPP